MYDILAVELHSIQVVLVMLFRFLLDFALLDLEAWDTLHRLFYLCLLFLLLLIFFFCFFIDHKNSGWWLWFMGKMG